MYTTSWAGSKCCSDAGLLVHTDAFICSDTMKPPFITLICVPQNCWLLPTSYIHQLVWKLVFAGNTADSKSSFSVFHICFSVTGLLSRRTQYGWSYFVYALKMVNSCQQAIQYHLPTLSSGELLTSQRCITSRFIFRCKHFHLIAINLDTAQSLSLSHIHMHTHQLLFCI